MPKNSKFKQKFKPNRLEDRKVKIGMDCRRLEFTRMMKILFPTWLNIIFNVVFFGASVMCVGYMMNSAAIQLVNIFDIKLKDDWSATPGLKYIKVKENIYGLLIILAILVVYTFIKFRAFIKMQVFSGIIRTILLAVFIIILFSDAVSTQFKGQPFTKSVVTDIDKSWVKTDTIGNFFLPRYKNF